MLSQPLLLLLLFYMLIQQELQLYSNYHILLHRFVVLEVLQVYHHKKLQESEQLWEELEFFLVS
jgi:hypothetical protein